MSLLGFDAIGRLALGQIQQGGVTNIVMPAAAGAFAFAGVAATFKITEAANVGAFTLAGAATFNIREIAAPGSFTLSLQTATLGRTLSAAVGTFTLTGIDPDEALNEDADPGAFVFTGNDAPLIRTGFDYEFQQGGIGHYLLELERAKQLAAITRKVPGVPIDRRTVPRFEPLRASPIAPPAPAVDLAAVQNERLAAAAAEAAKMRRRRDEEALLLLAC
ncbi:hypothetical protein J6524_04820 [Bradyrhizobium sp. WSM 1738]|uniref:hypothetical protein n=1 Tax=Bradyrhizobium hereditatis TaxID=2821405 RepID=UPI001CE33AB9|nr:hypothetical protein [Bradyrhizobium hereditatis]MCA6114252.1 hypothetical protein [Bradyrhizobium hereditatis]